MIEQALIEKKTVLRDGLVMFELHCPNIASKAAAGQFVEIKCSPANTLRRPISISAVEDGKLLLGIEKRGSGTEWLIDKEVGESLDVLGPLGNGFSFDINGRALIVGGGIGIFPLYQTAKNLKGNCTTVLAFKTSSLVVMEEEFSACGEVMIATDDGSAGFHGNAVEALLDAAKKESFSCIYACGPKPMMAAVAGAAKKLGIACQVSLEERMACGVGACLGCVCATVDGNKRVCKDGPVFDAEKVVW